MAVKPIAVQGASLVDDNVANTTTVNPTGSPDSKYSVDSKKAYKNQMGFQIATGSGIPGTCLLTAPVSDNISGSSSRIKDGGSSLVKEDDTKTVVTTGQHPVSGVPCPLTFNIRVNNAGQSKLNAE